MNRLHTHLGWWVVAAAIVSAPAAGAQPVAAGSEAPRTANASTGSVLGSVRDQTGAPLMGATVSAFGPTMAFAVTDRLGQFVLRSLPAGPYTVRAHLHGFAVSRRDMVYVGSTQLSLSPLTLRRLNDGEAVGTSGRTLPSHPILAAGVAAVPAPEAPAPQDPADPTTVARDDHGETAWRLRHLKRSVLRDTVERTTLVADAVGAADFDGESLISRVMESSARIAASLVTDFPLSGQIHFLTTSSFDSPGELLRHHDFQRGVAFLSIGAPAGETGRWSMVGSMTQGDVSSWVLAGSYSSRAPGAAHAYDLGMSYSTQRYEGGNAAALAAVTDGSRNVGALYGRDRWALSSHVAVDYGARYTWHDYMPGGGLVSPNAGVTVSPTAHTRIRADISQRRLAPGADEFIPRSPNGFWLPPERTFSSLDSSAALRAERTRHIEVEVEHDLFEALTLGVRRFAQSTDDQIVTVFGVGLDSSSQSHLGHYYLANGGSVDVQGWGVTMSHHLARRLRSSLGYTHARAIWAPSAQSGLLAAVAPSASRASSEEFHDVTTAVETDIPETATRVYVVYKLNTAFARPDADAETPGLGARFDVQVNQALPFLPFTSTRWEVLVAVRNLFRDQADEASIYDEVLVVRPPKRLVGGVTVRF